MQANHFTLMVPGPVYLGIQGISQINQPRANQHLGAVIYTNILIANSINLSIDYRIIAY